MFDLLWRTIDNLVFIATQKIKTLALKQKSIWPRYKQLVLHLPGDNQKNFYLMSEYDKINIYK